VRGYDRQSGYKEPYKLHGSMKAQQECVGSRAGKERVCIVLYDEKMSSCPVTLHR